MSPPAESAEPVYDQAFVSHSSKTLAGTIRLTFIGELDLVTAPDARAALRRAQRETRDVVCDLGDVIFVDLSGLRVLLDAAAHATARHGRLTIVNCPSIIPRMLELLRLQGELDIQPGPG